MSPSIADVLDRLARLDARAKAAPGQLGFDLTGGSSAGSGGGTKCGGSWIDPNKTCRKEGGAQPDAGKKPYKPTPQVKAGVSAKPMTFNAGGDSSYDPAAEKKQAAGGLKYYRTQRGGQSKQNYFFRDRQAAEHWYADSNAKSDADIEVGTANRRGKEWQAEYRASYEGTRNMLRDVGDRELLDTVEAYAAAGSATSRGTATDVRISGNPHSRPIREGTFGKQAATTKRPSLEEAITSQVQAGAEGRDAIIAELKTYGVELSQEEADEILSSDLADMLEAQQMIAAQKRRQAQTSPSVLSNPGRTDPGLAPKAKPEGLSAQEAVTSKQQAQLARQQQAAAKAAGDKRGAKAWREQERRVERGRLQSALQGQSQSQTSLFGVTEYDETMPLFGRRNDSADNTSRLLTQVLSEYLSQPQVIEWDTSRGSTYGRVVSEGLLYAFRCDGDSVAYKPAWDRINERQWELRSDGFLQARYPETRLDFKFQQKRSKRKCSKGYGCGSTCISMQKECRVQAKSAISKARLKALQALAMEGDAGAAQKARNVQEQRDATAQKLKGDRQVGKLKKMLEDPRIAELVRTGRLPEGESRGGDAPPKPGDVRNVSPDGIEVDPDRFQYKIGASASGEVGSLSGVRRWDPNLAGVVSVWQDPADGKTYVVNGHNRLGLARRLGAEQVTVRYLDAPDAKTARAIGAKQNIAEGAGTEVDAAKFFRDTGIKSMQQVEEQGLPLRSGKAEKGLALARLPEEMFQDVVQGRLRMRQAALIGASGLDEDKQREVYKVVKKNPKIQDETLGEYVEQLAFSQRQTQTTMDLFGAGEESVDTGLARADLTKSIKKTLSQEARLLASVSKSQKAVDILQEKGGNVINVGQSQEKAGEATTVLRLFDQLKLATGPVKTALDQAAARITNGESRSAVMKELREQVVEGLDEELRRLGLKDDEPRRNEAESMSMFDSADPIENLIRRIGQLQNRMDKGAAAPGGGQQCGASWIDPDKTCRKNGGSASKSAKEKLSEITKDRYADRTATRNQVIGVVSLDEPIKVKASFKGDDGKVINYEQTHNDVRYEVELKNYTSDAEDFRKKVGDVIGVDLSGSQVWDAAFMTGLGNSALSYSRNASMTPDAAKKISRAIRLELDTMIGGLADNTLVTCTPWTEDGLGDKRRKLYERAGFYTYSEKGSMVGIVRQGRLVKPSEFGIGRKDADDQINIEQLVYDLIMLESQSKASRTRQGLGGSNNRQRLTGRSRGNAR